MFYDLIITQPTKMLRNLLLILEKGTKHAEAKKIEFEVLLNSRLACDQFNLIRQIQIACDTAKFGASRLTGKEAPKHEDTEKTLMELRSRIEKTIAYLNTFSANDFAGAEDRKVTQPRWEGKHMRGYDYAVQYVTPNLYFHVTTAYDILRHNGVEIGKKDYLGEMPYKQ